MKAISIWLYSDKPREINIHNVEPELFEKLRPAFVKEWPEDSGRINVDDKTIVIFYKRQDVGMNNHFVKLNKINAWLDQPVGKAEKILLGITAVYVAVSIIIMIAKWI
jgi:hypothetical protein